MEAFSDLLENSIVQTQLILLKPIRSRPNNQFISQVYSNFLISAFSSDFSILKQTQLCLDLVE